MSDMVEVRTAELIGPALNWAVATVVDYKTVLEENDHGPDEWIVMGREDMYLTRDPSSFHVWSPSTDWSQGGPLIQKYGCDLLCIAQQNAWEASCWDSRLPNPGLHRKEAETPLIAACRVVVAAELGDIVEVPACLVNP